MDFKHVRMVKYIAAVFSVIGIITGIIFLAVKFFKGRNGDRQLS